MKYLSFVSALFVGVVLILVACGPATPPANSSDNATVGDLPDVADGGLERPAADEAESGAFDGDVDVDPVDVGFEKEQPETDPSIPGGLTPDDISLSLNGLAETSEWHLMPAVPYDPEQADNRLAAPPYLLLTYDGESPETVLADNGRRIAIYPVDAYRTLWDEADDPVVGLTLDHLKELLAQSGSETPPYLPLPLLPPPVGSNDLAAQIDFLAFEGGQGVRYIGRFGESPRFVTNDELYYYFQGLTDDGQYYVSGVFPVTTAVLAQDAAQAAPDVQSQFDADFPAYMRQQTAFLDGLMPTDWTPSLAQLDGLHASLALPTAVPPAPAPSITDIVWQWQFFEGSDDTVIPVPVPADYTLELWENGELHGRADCNDMRGVWRADGERLELDVQMVTTAVCDQGSLSEPYIAWLRSVAAYDLREDGTLALSLVGDVGELLFGNGGPVAGEEPPADASDVLDE
nr:hypothetical protein [uncultured bacterium]